MPVDSVWLEKAVEWAGSAERGLPADLGACLTQEYAGDLEYAKLQPAKKLIGETWFLDDELDTLLETPDESEQNHLSVRWWKRFAEGQTGIGRKVRWVVWFFAEAS
ncbi:hypothetical protein [Deinococcus arcticus]|uniref:hypothetical protein n=1 Tax=Deinococcus arcticus TaxID=2136176 RepID=UPI0011B1FBAC|nr:hypothetical protein [Deinococcus arcticus]